jgi:hypothetical protein
MNLIKFKTNKTFLKTKFLTFSFSFNLNLPGIVFGFLANVGGLRKSVRNFKISSSVNRSLSF